MTDRFKVVKEHIETAYTRDAGFLMLARFINTVVRGENYFLTPQERLRIATPCLGHMTEVPQLVATERQGQSNDRFVLSARRDGMFGLTVTDLLPGGAVNLYRIGSGIPPASTQEVLMNSPFINRLLEVVIETR